MEIRLERIHSRRSKEVGRGRRKGADGLSGDREDAVCEQTAPRTGSQRALSLSTEAPLSPGRRRAGKAAGIPPKCAGAEAGGVRTSAGMWAELMTSLRAARSQGWDSWGWEASHRLPGPGPGSQMLVPLHLPHGLVRGWGVIFFLSGRGCPQRVGTGAPGR